MRNIKRTVAGLVVLAAIAAPAAMAASSGSQGHITAHIDSTGTIHVSGYDGGAPLQP